MKIIPETRRAH